MARYVFSEGRNCPDKIALRLVGHDLNLRDQFSFSRLERSVLSSATGLAARGIGKGDRVLLRVGNSVDFPILFFASLALGAIPVPTSAMLTPGEVRYLADDLEPAAICASDELGGDLPAPYSVVTQTEFQGFATLPPAEYAATHCDDPAYIVYTSGTGGKPKGVLHAHRAAFARRMMWRGWYGLHPDDVILHAGAFNWTYTLGTGLTDPWAIGASTILYDGPADPGVWARIAAQYRPSIFAAVPGVYRQLLKSGENLNVSMASLRHGLSAGEKLPRQVERDWRGAAGKPIYEALGMSEISTYISASPETPPRTGRVGRPQPGRRVAILTDGREIAPVDTPGMLAVSRRDPGLMLGYWRRPYDTDAAFVGEWFLTGDRAEMDADGFIRHLGRSDDVMNAQGYRVSSQEVEDILVAFPGITEAAAVELPVADGVSVIAAVVPGTDDAARAEAILDYCSNRLARYKCPRKVLWVEALPRNRNGKILRRALIDQFGWKPEA